MVGGGPATHRPFGGPYERYRTPRGRIVGDDTVTEHPGDKVYGKARHRDAVRTSHSYTTWRWGHKWVVLAVLVPFPFATRPWALPILATLYHSREQSVTFSDAITAPQM
jgi:hypothetical protein